VLAVLFCFCAACGDDVCKNEDNKCDGNVAVTCQNSGGRSLSTTKSITRTACPASTTCVSGPGFAGCATDTTACTAALVGKGMACVGGVPSVCMQFYSEPGTGYYPQLSTPCLTGNTCYQGVCAQAQTVCDAATFTPSCAGGQPLGCPVNTLNPSYPAFSDVACKDGNTCQVTAAGDMAGCSKDGTACEYNSYRSHCEGGKLVYCETNSVVARKSSVGALQGMVAWKSCACTGDATSGSCP
jgi:hypothetical protein